MGLVVHFRLGFWEKLVRVEGNPERAFKLYSRTGSLLEGKTYCILLSFWR